MASRNHHLLPINRLPLSLSSVNPSPSSRAHHILEDRIAIQRRDIQTLLLDNQRLAAAHVALKQDLAHAQNDLRHLSTAAADVKAEREGQVREVYERSLKLEAEARAVDAMAKDVVQVRADVQKLTGDRRELVAELEAVGEELVKASKEAQQVAAVKAEIETMKKEIQRGRAAIEYEKKTKAINLEHGHKMEKNMSIIARKIEKLRAELANSEKRAQATAGAAVAANPSEFSYPGYVESYGNPEITFGESPYTNPYGMHQVQGGAASGPSFVAGALPNGPYDIQQIHTRG